MAYQDRPIPQGVVNYLLQLGLFIVVSLDVSALLLGASWLPLCVDAYMAIVIGRYALKYSGIEPVKTASFVSIAAMVIRVVTVVKFGTFRPGSNIAGESLSICGAVLWLVACFSAVTLYYASPQHRTFTDEAMRVNLDGDTNRT